MKVEIPIILASVFNYCATLAFLPFQPIRRPSTFLHHARSTGGYSIQYSSNFHRHVVCKNDVVKESFLWLDEAVEKYPNAKFLPLSTSVTFQTLKQRKKAKKGRTRKAVVAISDEHKILKRYDSVDMAAKDSGTSVGNMYRVIQTCRQYKGIFYTYEEAVAQIETESEDVPLIAGGGLRTDDAYDLTTATKLCYQVNVDEATLQKFDSVVRSLDSKLRSSFFEKFPVADRIWIKERMLFFLAPKPNSFAQKDWVVKFCNGGYGAGMTEAQTVTAILALRHFLQFYPNDSNSGKPEPAYFYQQLKIKFDVIDQARIELNYWLSSACSADLLSFAFLNSLGVSWDQCRILLESLSASVVSSELEPNWELSTSRSPVRHQLRADAMNCFRMRLRLSPSEIYDILKVNKRMSYHSECKMTSCMDHLQAKMLLSSQELRTLVFKNPTILGYTTEKLDKQLEFFSQEGMSHACKISC